MKQGNKQKKKNHYSWRMSFLHFQISSLINLKEYKLKPLVKLRQMVFCTDFFIIKMLLCVSLDIFWFVYLDVVIILWIKETML